MMTESTREERRVNDGVALLRAAQKALEAALLELRHLDPDIGGEKLNERAARALSVAFSALIQRSQEEYFR